MLMWILFGNRMGQECTRMVEGRLRDSCSVPYLLRVQGLSQVPASWEVGNIGCLYDIIPRSQGMGGTSSEIGPLTDRQTDRIIYDGGGVASSSQP